MSAEAATSVAASTEAARLFKDFLDSVQQYKPPAYMLNTALKRRVYRSFVNDTLSIESVEQLCQVAQGLHYKSIRQSTDRNGFINYAEFTDNSRAVEVVGTRSPDCSFYCKITKDGKIAYQSTFADDWYSEEHAQRPTYQRSGELAYEDSFFCTTKRSQRSFRVRAAPDPDNEKTVFAGNRNEAGSKVMVFRPGHGIVFHRDQDEQRQTDTLMVYSHAGTLMYHVINKIGQLPDVRCCNEELIKSECLKWGASSSDADDSDLSLVQIVNNTGRSDGKSFFSEPGDFKQDPPDPCLSESMRDASTWGDRVAPPPARRSQENVLRSGYRDGANSRSPRRAQSPSRDYESQAVYYSDAHEIVDPIDDSSFRGHHNSNGPGHNLQHGERAPGFGPRVATIPESSEAPNAISQRHDATLSTNDDNQAVNPAPPFPTLQSKEKDKSRLDACCVLL